VPTHCRKEALHDSSYPTGTKKAGMVSPNPLVGAVISEGNEMVGSAITISMAGIMPKCNALKKARERGTGR